MGGSEEASCRVRLGLQGQLQQTLRTQELEFAQGGLTEDGHAENPKATLNPGSSGSHHLYVVQELSRLHPKLPFSSFPNDSSPRLPCGRFPVSLQGSASVPLSVGGHARLPTLNQGSLPCRPRECRGQEDTLLS